MKKVLLKGAIYTCLLWSPFVSFSVYSSDEAMASDNWVIFWGRNENQSFWTTLPLREASSKEDNYITNPATIWSVLRLEIGVDAFVVSDSLLHASFLTDEVEVRLPLSDPLQILAQAMDVFLMQDDGVACELLYPVEVYANKNQRVSFIASPVIVSISPAQRILQRNSLIHLSNLLATMTPSQSEIDTEGTNILLPNSDSETIAVFWKNSILLPWGLAVDYVLVNPDRGYMQVSFTTRTDFNQWAAIMSGQQLLVERTHP